MGKEENNIFKFATKELSQDAIISWLVNCYNIEKDREIGEDFIKKFIFKKENDIEIKSVEVPITQKNKIDVFLDIDTNQGRYLIICEDKTDTFLHGEQLNKSLTRVLNEYKDKKFNIKYLLFKSGNVLPFEKLQYGEEQKIFLQGNPNSNVTFEIRELKDFTKALIDNKKDNELLNMIIEYYREKEKQNIENRNWITNIEDNEWARFYEEIVNEVEKQNILIEAGFEKFPRPVGGNSKRPYRTNFILEDKKFLENANKIIQNCRWEIIINWYEEPQIMFYCDVSEGRYKPEKNFSDVEKAKAKKRQQLIYKFKEKLKESKEDEIKSCNAHRNAIGIIKIEVRGNISSKTMIEKIKKMYKFIEETLKEQID